MSSQAALLIHGDALKNAAHAYLAYIQAKSKDQNDPLSIFDKWFLRIVTRLSSLASDKSWEEQIQQEIIGSGKPQPALEWEFLRLRLFLDRWQQGRFVTYAQRELSGIHYYPKYGTEFGSDVLLTCQGAPAFMEWQGLPLMKTTFDFSLYPQLIAELRPQTIFEIGSGSGASAIWYADLLSTLKITGHVHSVDIHKVSRNYSGVTFAQGDCGQPENLFDSNLLRLAPHPWLVIEDAHHNVEAVLNTLHPHMKKGDYLYVEDSEIKRQDIRRFLSKYPSYLVDTKYTDFFGRNATCALDSIFIKTQD